MTTNLDVALYSLSKSPFWGSGFGGHASMYEKFYRGTYFVRHDNFGINRNSAHSLLIESFPNTGLLE